MRRGAEKGSFVKNILFLLEQQNYKCALSGRVLAPDVAALDHKIPLARGGAKMDAANLQIIHADVNRAKHTMTNDEFIAMCAEVTRNIEAKK